MNERQVPTLEHDGIRILTRHYLGFNDPRLAARLARVRKSTRDQLMPCAAQQVDLAGRATDSYIPIILGGGVRNVCLTQSFRKPTFR